MSLATGSLLFPGAVPIRRLTVGAGDRCWRRPFVAVLHRPGNPNVATPFTSAFLGVDFDVANHIHEATLEYT